MLSWSRRRQLIYGTLFVTFFLLASGVIAFLLTYERPSCFDGRRSQDERGIDCGGVCIRLCSEDVKTVAVRWQKFFKVSDTLYSVAAYLENRNADAEAFSVPYTFALYGPAQKLLIERSGATYIPPSSSFIIYEGTFELPSDPKDATFRFTAQPIWKRSVRDHLPVSVVQRALLKTKTTPRIEATVENRLAQELSDVEVAAAVFDTRGEAVGVSKTIIPTLPPHGSKDIVFTWPKPFDTPIERCESPVDVVLIIDRSGSMDDEGGTPLQPLADAKSAAISFVREVGSRDKLGLVTFATAASLDQILTSNHEALIKRIDSIAIRTGTTQYTNMGEAIREAFKELKSPRHEMGKDAVTIILTDGISTHPVRRGDPSYPEKYAENFAAEAKAAGMIIYTIGLGRNPNFEHLARIATSPAYTYRALTSKDLSAIYERIGTKICRRPASVFEVIPKVNYGEGNS